MLLLTMLDEKIWPHCYDFYENKKSYADRHGYDFQCVTIPSDWLKEYPAAAFKLVAIERCLREGYEVAWMDMDMIIMDHFNRLPCGFAEPVARLEEKPGYFCTGFMLFPWCPEANELLEHWIEAYIDMPFLEHPWEQQTLNN